MGFTFRVVDGTSYVGKLLPTKLSGCLVLVTLIQVLFGQREGGGGENMNMNECVCVYWE